MRSLPDTRNRLSVDHLNTIAFELREKLLANSATKPEVRSALEQVASLDEQRSDQEKFSQTRTAIETLKKLLAGSPEESLEGQLLENISYLKYKAVWIVGGDGWAYDIGYGGLDHALASGQDINVLVLDTEVYSNTGGQRSKATFLGAVAKFAALGKEVQKKDLGMMAMSYGNVYVASVSFGANMNQTLKAMREAAAYPGPSIIIAYSNCIEHGINMETGPDHSKLAVDCGYWMLYRYNPDLLKENKNPLVIESKEPTKSLEEFYLAQRRFKTLMESNPDEAKHYLEEASKFVRNRYRHYLQLAEMSYADFEA